MSSNLWNASFSLEEFNSQGSPIGQKGDSQFFPRVCLLSDQSKFCAWINESDQDGMDSISIKAQHLSDNGDLIQELNLYESTDSIAELYIEGVCRSKVLLSFKLEKDFDLSTQILLDLNNYSFKIIKVHGKANPNHFSSSSIKEDLIYFSLLEKHQGNSVLNIWNKSI